MSDVMLPSGAEAGHAVAPADTNGAATAGHGPGPGGPPVIPPFDIVPRAGIIAAGIAVVAIVAAIAADKLWPLMFLHVAGGASWTIVDLFLGLVLGPILGSLSIPARIEMTTKLMPKMVVIMPIVVTMTLASGWQLGFHEGTVLTSYHNHAWVVASFIVVGVMAVLALGLLEPANIAVLVELRKRQPNPAVIERLMKRFIYCAGVLGMMQVATIVIMTKLASG
jgi:hypothetical protein